MQVEDEVTQGSKQGAAGRPKNAIVMLLDSLNRHMLGAYGGAEFATPNLEGSRARSLRFEKHYSGSLPCMPARHDILCGALDFLWRPWGSVEMWERTLTSYLRGAGVTTMLISDHPHLFETGGENYHTEFTAWEYQRGHESDPWRTRPDPSASARRPIGPRGRMPYDNSRGVLPRARPTSRARGRWRRQRNGSTRTPAITTASSCSWTSSTRTSRSIRRTRMR